MNSSDRQRHPGHHLPGRVQQRGPVQRLGRADRPGHPVRARTNSRSDDADSRSRPDDADSGSPTRRSRPRVPARHPGHIRLPPAPADAPGTGPTTARTCRANCDAATDNLATSRASGAQFLLSGSAWDPGDVITFSSTSADGDTAGLGLQPVTVGSSGSWQETGAIPASAAAGDTYTISMSDSVGCTAVLPSRTFTVTGHGHHAARPRRHRRRPLRAAPPRAAADNAGRCNPSVSISPGSGLPGPRSRCRAQLVSQETCSTFDHGQQDGRFLELWACPASVTAAAAAAGRPRSHPCYRQGVRCVPDRYQ